MKYRIYLYLFVFLLFLCLFTSLQEGIIIQNTQHNIQPIIQGKQQPPHLYDGHPKGHGANTPNTKGAVGIIKK